ncbi:MAG: ribonuclease HI family protein [Proteobacteria bacterium]|nr:ribonuclease HI family protein [Pseudomonadota bacterium]
MILLGFTDGASRGNPGESGIGVILKDPQGTTVSLLGEYIGKATNNVAEYRALIRCLSLAGELGCTRLIVHSDSELMVKQLHGLYRVKDTDLKRHYADIQTTLKKAPFSFEIRHVDRSQNKEADSLANRALDLRTSVDF